MNNCLIMKINEGIENNILPGYASFDMLVNTQSSPLFRPGAGTRVVVIGDGSFKVNNRGEALTEYTGIAAETVTFSAGNYKVRVFPLSYTERIAFAAVGFIFPDSSLLYHSNYSNFNVESCNFENGCSIKDLQNCFKNVEYTSVNLSGSNVHGDIKDFGVAINVQKIYIKGASISGTIEDLAAEFISNYASVGKTSGSYDIITDDSVNVTYNGQRIASGHLTINNGTFTYS